MHLEPFDGKRILHSGRLIDVFNLRPEDIDIVEIAHALSLICRFGGHTPMHYSVAEHSINVASHCRAWPKHALLHDAAETYLGDTCGTLKGLLCFKGHIEPYAGFLTLNDLDQIITRTILERFGLDPPEIPGDVWVADKRMLSTEALAFFPDNEHWKPWLEIAPYEPLPPPVWTTQEIEAGFLKLWKELT